MHLGFSFYQSHVFVTPVRITKESESPIIFHDRVRVYVKLMRYIKLIDTDSIFVSRKKNFTSTGYNLNSTQYFLYICMLYEGYKIKIKILHIYIILDRITLKIVYKKWASLCARVINFYHVITFIPSAYHKIFH